MKEENPIPYYQSVKFLRRWLKPNTVVFFDELMDQHKYWKKNSSIFRMKTGYEYRGVFYRSRADIAKFIGLKKGAQLAAESILKEMGLLTVTHQADHPNRYKINTKRLTELYQEYEAEEAKIKAEKSKTKLPPNYAELIADYQELDGDVTETQMTSSPETGAVLIQDADRNKNKETKIKNKNKVSKVTNVPDGTKVLDQEIN